MTQTTAFGKAIKHRLLDLDMSQKELISQVSQKTGLYFDSSYFAKIMRGKNTPPKIVKAICEILELEVKEGD